jgi:acyl-coenzyme A thioesterase PaaI-like protein
VTSDNDQQSRPWRSDDDLARHCYACGDLNPLGLQMKFRMEGDWAISDFVARPEHQGYPGYVHGGLVSTLLDEAIGWATYGKGVWALTGRLETRFRGIVPTGEPLHVRAVITNDRGRTLEATAELTDATGKVLADAKALMFRATGEQARRIEQAARARAGLTNS